MSNVNILQSSRSGMTTSQAGIATAGHNISNANTEGYSRQRVKSEAQVSGQMNAMGGPYVGQGSKLTTIERVNDQYLEHQLRDGARDMAHFEEKQVFLGQVEDVFNEMNGDGLNRIVAKFFNEFRKLANDPTSEAIRQSVRESSTAMVNDFKRIRVDLDQIRAHIDNRIDGNMRELNDLAVQLKELNVRIHAAEIQGHPASDLEDRRDHILQKMSTYVDLSVHKDNNNMVSVDIRGVGPIVTGPNHNEYYLGRAPAQEAEGSPDGALQISRSQFGGQYITQQFQGGKLGALIETRDKMMGGVIDRLDQLAHAIATSVNELHQQGVTANGKTGISFFKPIDQVSGASHALALSDEIKADVTNIATGIAPHAASDNRLALALANLQNARFMNDGSTTVDDFYNSIVSEVGVASAKNTEALGQQKGILSNMQKMRDQISGVSIDEEVTNLMQFQHAFDASARVMKVADDMMDTILRLRS